MKDINKTLVAIEKLQKISNSRIYDIKEWWDGHEEMVGKKIGKYRLCRYMFSTAYSGCYETAIFVDDVNKEEVGNYNNQKVLGKGTHGDIDYGYNCATLECASREQHLEFMQTFPSFLKNHLQKIHNEEKKIKEHAENMQVPMVC